MNTDTKVADLLPCPFCGPGESIVACCFDDVSNRYRVYCGGCGSSTGIHPTDRTEAPAISAWNRRAALARQEPTAPPAAQAVDLEQFRGAVEAYKAAVNEDCYFDPSDYDDNISYADRLLALIDQQAGKGADNG